ncbi:unnamed protein product [Heterobilharzia americana]|nr:unnamed protein product [Heterobilharzia americana]
MTFPTMKTFKKNSEMPANNQCAEIFDLACELHVNPANRQSHMNVKNLTSSTSEVTSPSNPICTDSHLYDTAVNRMFTLDSDYFKRPQFQCLPNCQDIPLASEEKGLSTLFP